MTRQVLNVGSVANDGTGDDLRSAFQKAEANFTELYAGSFTGSQLAVSGNELYSTVSNANLKLTASGTGAIELENIMISDNYIRTTSSNSDLSLSGSGTGAVKFSGIKFPTADGTNGQVLQTDGNGQLSFGGAMTFVGDDSTGSSVALGSTFKFVGGTNCTTSVTGDQVTINATVASTGVFTTVKGGNIEIEGNTITNTNTNEHIDLIPNGTGNVRIMSGVGLDYNTTTGSSSALVTIDQFTTATYRSAVYQIQISDATNLEYQTSMVSVVHDGSTASASEYGVVYSGSRQLATISADINSGLVRIRAIPLGSQALVYKTFRSSIIA